jgi:hypothetical protein
VVLEVVDRTIELLELVTRYGVEEGRVNKFQLVEEYLLRS